MIKSVRKKRCTIDTVWRWLYGCALMFVLSGIPSVSLFAAQSASDGGQDRQFSITGKVTDGNGDPLPGVNVVIKGTIRGVSTGTKGEYTLVVNSSSIIQFSMIGYKTTEYNVGTKTTLNVVLEEDVKEMDQVVVIGYQTVAKRDVHGAVSTIKFDKQEAISAPSFDIMIQGQIPGLNVQVMSGAPGAKTIFNIRGNTALGLNEVSEPLFVLDGVPVDASVVGYSTTSTNFLANINPSDIESIDILKDASSASIYGSRAANGVIIIKTKSGKSGKPTVSFNAREGIAFKPELPVVYVGATERRMRMKMFENGSGLTPQTLKEHPLLLTDSLNPAFNNATDWYGLFYKDAALTQDYNLSVSGGNNNFMYRTGVGYSDEQGIMSGTGLKRFSFNGNYTSLIGERFTFRTIVGYSNTQRQAPISEETSSAINLNIGSQMMPSSLYYLDDVDKSRYLGTYDAARNDNTDQSFRLSEIVNINIFRWLTFNSQSSYSVYNSLLDRFFPAAISNIGKSEASSEARKTSSIDIENYFNVDKTFGSYHKLSGVAGFSSTRVTNNVTRVSGEYIPSDLIQVVSGVPQQYKDGYSDIDESSLMGLFARVQYYYRDRYSIFASIRRDGSSKLAKENRWGYFPSFGAFWTFSKEPFMENIKDVLTFAKLRVSYGQSGRQPSGNSYGYFNRYQVAGSFNGDIAITPNYSGIAQKDLKWENTEEINLGIDLEFLDGRFFFQTDFYNKDIDGLFYSLRLPDQSGYSSYNTNAFGIRNRGVEMNITANILPPSVRDWSWMFTINAGYNKNTISKMPFGNKSFEDGDRYFSVGSPLNMFYLGIYEGVYASDSDVPVNPYTGDTYVAENGKPFAAGDAILKDINGDYIWRSYQDKMPIGNPNPDWVGGINSSLRWKKFTLDINSSFTLGRDVYNQSLENSLRVYSGQSGYDEYGRDYSNRGRGTTYAGPKDYIARRMLTDMSGLNFWTTEGDDADYPNLTPYMTVANFKSNTSMYLENGSYFKLNSITLTYRVGSLLNNKVSNMRIWGTIQNLFVLTAKGCNIPNPETVNSQGLYTGNGYALPRILTLGIQVDF